MHQEYRCTVSEKENDTLLDSDHSMREMTVDSCCAILSSHKAVFDIWMILLYSLSLAIPDDAPVLEESDNEDDMESDRRISSKCTLLSWTV